MIHIDGEPRSSGVFFSGLELDIDTQHRQVIIFTGDDPAEEAERRQNVAALFEAAGYKVIRFDLS